jgi:hypothetical protein
MPSGFLQNETRQCHPNLLNLQSAFDSISEDTMMEQIPAASCPKFRFLVKMMIHDDTMVKRDESVMNP